MRFCPCDCSVLESNDIILYENGVQFLFIHLSFSVSESHMDYIAHMYLFSSMFLSFPFPWFMQMVFLFLSFPFHISLWPLPGAFLICLILIALERKLWSLNLCSVFVCVFMGNRNIFFTSAYGERIDFKRTAPFLLAKQKMRVS